MQLEIKDGAVLSWADAGTLFPREGATIVGFDGTLADLGRVGNLPEGYPEGAADFRAYAAPQGTSPVVPATVTRAQAKIALLRAGLLENVKAAVSAAGGEVEIWFADAPTWERANAYVVALGAELALTTAQIDALFVQAAQITA